MTNSAEENEDDEQGFPIFKDPCKSFSAIRKAMEVLLFESGEPDRAALMAIGPLLMIAGGLLTPPDAAPVEYMSPEDLFGISYASVTEYGLSIIAERIDDPDTIKAVVDSFYRFVAMSSIMLAKSVEDEVSFKDHPMFDSMYKEFLSTLATSVASKN